MLEGDAMTAQAENPALAAWKRQLDSTLRMIEAICEGSRKIGEAQLKAAIEAHASAAAADKILAKAGDAQELWRIQNEWLAASAEKSLAYWRELCEVVMETQSTIAKSLSEQPSSDPERRDAA
jgi:phasin family protein